MASVPFLLVTFLSISAISARCPSRDVTQCNCTEGQTLNELLVSCDSLGNAAEIAYQLGGFKPYQSQIVELAILRSKDLSGLRADFFDEMTGLIRLSLAANQGAKLRLPQGIFDKLGKKLETLDLSTSSLTEMDLVPEVFSPLTKLRELDLSFNQIKDVRKMFFDNLRNLETLDLGDNKLTRLPSGLLASCKKLKMLDFNDNQLTEFPMDLFEDRQPNLKILDIGGNRIRDLTSDHFALMPNLTVLDLRKNRISPLPSDLFSRTPKLQRVSLDGIAAPVIPPTIFDGLQLESLDISDPVYLRSLPEGLLSTVGSTLKELHLDDNWQLQTLPPKFFQGCDALEILDLGNTSLSLLPNTFFSDLKSLRKLKISDNPFLISLPPPKQFSQNLKIIDFKNCPKLPPVVTKWLNNNFDTRAQLLDFPINIYRSVHRGEAVFGIIQQNFNDQVVTFTEIMVRQANRAPPPTQPPPPTTRRPYNNNGNQNNNGNNYNNNGNNYNNNQNSNNYNSGW